MCVKVNRNKKCGHPWNQSPGWEGLNVIADTAHELTAYISRAKKRFWLIWFIRSVGDPADQKPAAYLYRPRWIKQAWGDPQEMPYAVYGGVSHGNQ